MRTKQLQTEAVNVAFNAGEKLLYFAKKLNSLKITSKQQEGLVSTADIESEKLIVKGLRKKYPDHTFLGEENSYGKSMMTPKQFAEAPACWIIDPLDGTHNFLNGLDYYAVCIGFASYGQVLSGVVYRPTTGECFTAEAGKGAYVQNLVAATKRKKLAAFTTGKKMRDSLLTTGFVSEKGKLNRSEFARFQSVFSESRGVRRMGSASLDMCLVAQGVFAGFWESGLGPWDTAASSVICRETGVKISSFSGGQYCPFSSTILAARNPVYNRMRKLIGN